MHLPGRYIVKEIRRLPMFTHVHLPISPLSPYIPNVLTLLDEVKAAACVVGNGESGKGAAVEVVAGRTITWFGSSGEDGGAVGGGGGDDDEHGLLHKLVDYDVGPTSEVGSLSPSTTTTTTNNVDNADNHDEGDDGDHKDNDDNSTDNNNNDVLYTHQLPEIPHSYHSALSASLSHFDAVDLLVRESLLLRRRRRRRTHRGRTGNPGGLLVAPFDNRQFRPRSS